MMTPTSEEKIQQIDEMIVQNALDETGFGKFNFKILAVTALICMNAAFGMLSNGFILPAAACDFKMTTEDKGHLTVSTMLGMLSGSYFWGCFADMKGRRTSLLGSLFLHSASEFLASLVPFYWGFVVFKFTSGLAICGQLTVLYTYLAEFQPIIKRNTFLSWMETSWVMGMVIVACLAWITIPSNIGIKTDMFSFNSWNLFIMICSLPSFFIGVCLIFLPETPKYLAEIGQTVSMLNVLSKMYSENTGKPSEEYLTNLKNSNNQVLSELVLRLGERINEKEDKIPSKTLRTILKNTFMQTLMLVRKPYLHRTFIVCSATYLIMSSYYMLLLWLPDLFQRYAEFQTRYPNQSATVCTVIAFEKNNETVSSMNPNNCDIPIQNSVFLYAFILALAGVPVGLTLPLLINRLGYKFFLVTSTVIASLSSFCIFLVKTSIENLIISCIFESFTSICVSVVSCMLIDFYPTHLRSIAAGLASFFSRLGAMMGTLMTGLLIDNHCTILIVLVGIQLLICSILSILTPKNNK
ncbi:PREDICTED: synaptic vesicle glycoprotein 2B-like isoform X2 [Polistes dominula]|uniref:Synaptic vesicle glycoprotein 2B-like isoform X2 n=1 Tax=Polistes dominula TaxID=743375 RepID=A0ABM1IF05_POLDO|nr:PREDICTED: synaptic vesicle glycoprotein 2B-like isoform X2 [Polistes dominula]